MPEIDQAQKAGFPPTTAGMATYPAAPSTDDPDTHNIIDIYGAMRRGRLVKNVAGNADIALTAHEALYDSIEFTGALTGDVIVTLPAAPSGLRLMENSASGASALKVKVDGQNDAAATTLEAGTNIVEHLGDSHSIVARNPWSPLSILSKNADYVLLASDLYKIVRLTGNTERTFTLPDITGDVVTGAWFIVQAATTAGLTLQGNGTDNIDGANTKEIGPGGAILVYVTGPSAWRSFGDPGIGPAVSAELDVTSNWQNIADGYADDDIITVSTEGAYSSESANIAMAGVTNKFNRFSTDSRWLGIRANANGARIEIRRNGTAIQARSQGQTAATKAWITKWT